MEINDSTKRFLNILGKIPMFQRLLPAQALEILKICAPRSLGNRERVCEYGTKSTEMFILLSGSLTVMAPDGTPLTKLQPITTVGEMGLITGQPRAATVVAENKANIFVLPKIKFEVLMKKYPDIGFIIYRNIIQILSQRLEGTNKQLVDCKHELSELQSQPGVLSS